MPSGEPEGAVLGRSEEVPWVTVGADGLSIVPSVPRHIGIDASFPELHCLRDRLPPDVIAAAQRRAAALGVGADRVLLAAGTIAEEDYLRALAADCDVAFDPLVETPRSACPLSDAQLIESVGVGLLPLHVDGDLVLVVAPRGIAAQRLAGLFASASHIARRFRFTSTACLHQFLGRHGSEALGRRAAEGLQMAKPALSAAPRRGQILTAVVVLALAAFVSSLIAPPWTIAALDVILAMFFLAWIALRLIGSLAKDPGPSPQAQLSDHELPVYTIIAALYREAASVRSLADSLRQLDYPPEKLDIKFVVEADDVETKSAIERLHLGVPFEVITVPEVGPRTKPKALNAALPFARGTFLVIYDAEDRPERDQCRRALDMFMTDGGLACVQARLAIDNTADSWLTRIFTAEYAGQFDVFLPGLAALRLPLPLGGSSNHFRTAMLRQAGAWDPYNVTEDADLGIRLCRFGYRSAVIDSTTYEEAPARFLPWLRQRTRWFKGWTKTWLVHMRAPRQLLRELGLPGFLTFQLIVGGNVLAALIYPLFMLGMLHELVTQPPPGQGIGEALLGSLHVTTLVAGYLASGFVGWLGLVRRGLGKFSWVLVLIPLHWMLLSAAAWRALYQLLRDPYRWEKTEHGLAHTSRRRDVIESVTRILARESQMLSIVPANPAA